MRGIRYVYKYCKSSPNNDDLENALVEDGYDGPDGPGGARGGLNDKPAPSKEQLQVQLRCVLVFFSILNSQISQNLSILLNSSQFFSFRCELLVLIMVLRLFQVKKSAKSLQDPVSKKKPLFQDIPKNLQKPLQDDDPFRTRAATNPSTAAAGILLFSPDSPNFFPILSLYYVLF